MAEAKGSGGLAARIKKARATATRLGAKSNELNEELTKAEEAIAALRLGVSAQVMMHADDESGDETYLCFERFEGKWSLTILEGRPDVEMWSTNPLMKVSRSLRMEAARNLPALVDKLMERTETEIVEVDETTAKVAAFVKELREAQS
jgi:hypothetical protein